MSQPQPPPYAAAVDEKKDFDSSQPPINPSYQGAPTGYAPVPTGYGGISPNPQPPYYNQPPYPPNPATGYGGIPSNPEPAYYNQPAYAPTAETAYPTGQPMQPPSAAAGFGNSGFTTGKSFDDKAVRQVFIRKVFAILGVQLLVTFGIVCAFFFIEAVHDFLDDYPAVYYVSYAVFLATYISLICCTDFARRYPYNLITLGVLTLALSYMVGTIASFYTVEAVVIGLGVTALVCVTVMIFSIQTKFDFTTCGGLLFVLVMVLFFFGLITIFTHSRSWYVQVVYGCLGALVFTLFLAYDTQLVIGGRKYELDPEEYVFGALNLYIDIVYIFIFLLSIFGGSN